MTDPASSPIRTEAHADAGRVIAVTGVSGLIGQRLLPLLEAMPDVERIIGIDVKEPARRVNCLEMHLVDVTSAQAATLLDGVDAVVHLAAVVGPVTERELARSVNIDGTKNLLAAAGKANVRTVIRASSAAVYGAWEHNALPLTETAMLRPNPGYEPAIDDAECERLLLDWSEAHLSAQVTWLRVAPVVGAGARSVFARAAVGRPPAVVRGSNPPVQVVHVDDVASAIVHVLEHDLDGVFNVAADGWLEHDDARAVAPHKRPPAVPYDMAHKALSAMWASGIGDAPPEVLPYVMHSWVISNEKLKATGWAPRHTNEEAVLLAGDPDVRRRPLPWLAAVGAVVTGAAGATWWLTRRRRP